MGHLSFYNKNQIRDKLLLVLIFLEQVRWQSYGIGLEKQYYMLRNAEDAVLCVNITMYQFVDMKEKGMSKGEFNSVAQVNGGLENMINWEGKDKDLLALIKYIVDEDKLEKVLENPQVIKTPVVRNGKQSTLGYHPDIWKGWN